ncbi:MAG: iron-containing redox enzyme family protein [Acidobacteriaceae bacterium]|nr:iron-containing redox enzyme family protein [Acidobacteriaceae bacterium]MBV9498000.1 iron-containing redox enzyme family protein [Acidobacteriaceae bacterium]
MSSIDSVLVASKETPTEALTDTVKAYLNSITDDLLASLPDADRLTPSERRGIIGRYAAVLEGNFIYWMTGAYLAAGSEEARSIITDNLLEEVRDSHPAMLRRFVMAANALPTEEDVLAVAPNLLEVRLFIGRLSAAPIMAMMAFFESFIQRFMPYLEDLARRQGSTEDEYTQVHGVCDIGHSEGLFQGLAAELALTLDSREPAEYLYEGVHLLRSLLETTFDGRSRVAA